MGRTISTYSISISEFWSDVDARESQHGVTAYIRCQWLWIGIASIRILRTHSQLVTPSWLLRVSFWWQKSHITHSLTCRFLTPPLKFTIISFYSYLLQTTVLNFFIMWILICNGDKRKLICWIMSCWSGDSHDPRGKKVGLSRWFWEKTYLLQNALVHVTWILLKSMSKLHLFISSF